MRTGVRTERSAAGEDMLAPAAVARIRTEDQQQRQRERSQLEGDIREAHTLRHKELRWEKFTLGTLPAAQIKSFLTTTNNRNHRTPPFAQARCPNVSTSWRHEI